MSNVILIELIDEGVSSSLRKEGGTRNSNDIFNTPPFYRLWFLSPPVVPNDMRLKAVKVSHILLSGYISK